jgi:hypothetical protein
MSETPSWAPDPESAIACIPRRDLPPWLSEALDALARNLALFPPVADEDREMIGHLYPH